MSAFEKEERWNVLLTYAEAFWIDPPVNIQKIAYLNTAADFFFYLQEPISASLYWQLSLKNLFAHRHS